MSRGAQFGDGVAIAESKGPSLENHKLHGVRVLFVLPGLGLGGAERQAFLLARYLVRHHGADVKLVGMGLIGDLAELCNHHGIPWEVFQTTHGYRQRFRQAWDVARLAALFRRRRVQVLLPYCMLQNIMCALAWRLGGVEVCIWNQRDEGRGRVPRWVERAAVRNVRCFTSNSAQGSEFLTGPLGIAPERVHLIHNGVELAKPETDREAWRVKLGVGPDDFLACMVANIHGYKDHATLVAAWRRVADVLTARGVNAHLVLAGFWMDTYAAIVAQVESLRLTQYVHLPGVVRDVSGLLSAADLGVFSSFREGLPNGVLECMTSGLAVAGTDYAGIREALGPDAAELLAPPQDAEGLAECIVRAAGDARLRARLGRAGVDRVRNEFSVEAMGKRVVDLIVRERNR